MSSAKELWRHVKGKEDDKKCRYFLETRAGEAVDLIKAAILSRPAVRQSPKNAGQEGKRYQITTFVPNAEERESPLSGRLSELLGSEEKDNERSPGMVLSRDPGALLEDWSPASAMRLAREKVGDNDIIPTIKSKRQKSAKRSLKLTDK